jgi:hypothetical protein
MLSVVALTYLLVLLRFNPRIFLRHYPREIREIVPPKSDKERRISILLGVPFILMLLVAPFTSALLWRTASQRRASFWELFAHAFGVFFLFNLADLLILDWLIVCRFKPRWVVLPGAEHFLIARPYLHHFKGFLIGTVGSVVVGLAIAALLNIQS